MGNSMGGATAVLAAASDQRIEALILDSTHARVEDVVGRRLEVDEGQPSLPGTPAILLGVWLRTGLNLMDANPIDFIPALGHRPLLLIHGTADLQDLPERSVNANYRAAQAADVPVELPHVRGRDARPCHRHLPGRLGELERGLPRPRLRAGELSSPLRAAAYRLRT